MNKHIFIKACSENCSHKKGICTNCVLEVWSLNFIVLNNNIYFIVHLPFKREILQTDVWFFGLVFFFFLLSSPEAGYRNMGVVYFGNIHHSNYDKISVKLFPCMALSQLLLELNLSYL